MADSKNIHEVNGKDQFELEVLNSDADYILIDFWAEWCTPCRLVAPIVEEIANTLEGKIKVVKVDVDSNQEIAMQYQILSIPTLMLFKPKSAEDSSERPNSIMVGARPKPAILQWLHEQGVDTDAAAEDKT
jgi:thioredoxin 1